MEKYVIVIIVIEQPAPEPASVVVEPLTVVIGIVGIARSRNAALILSVQNPEIRL